ncbi:hypothetical protein PJF56_13260 [Roseofilum sp. BLCC_M91]|uniref:ATPase n=1 Tax=Roseofilum halophilum BLCC-M91 TaxID=3022259 RepID=A0ABT7BKW9_9CYAN|nr:hypothetical protein [Roseofilum halophilum]MDJ1179835.1 hypothetical protein [Roseofilum halophilum BLCC-M91]
MSSMDDFLNELKAQHQQKQSGERQPLPPDRAEGKDREENTMDDLLADLKSQFSSSREEERSPSDLEAIRQRYEQPQNSSVESPDSESELDALRQHYEQQHSPSGGDSEESNLDLEQIRQRYEAPKQQSSAPSSNTEPDLEQVRLRAMQMRSQREAAKASAAQTDDVLDNMRDSFIQNRAIERQKREAAQREEKMRRQQLEALKPRAKEWLARLDPYSDEGFWFESFAQGYGDRLEAALDYLQALEG